jgi:hypothetical protein
MMHNLGESWGKGYNGFLTPTYPNNCKVCTKWLPCSRELEQNILAGSSSFSTAKLSSWDHFWGRFMFWLNKRSSFCLFLSHSLITPIHFPFCKHTIALYILCVLRIWSRSRRHGKGGKIQKLQIFQWTLIRAAFQITFRYQPV